MKETKAVLRRKKKKEPGAEEKAAPAAEAPESRNGGGAAETGRPGIPRGEVRWPEKNAPRDRPTRNSSRRRGSSAGSARGTSSYIDYKNVDILKKYIPDRGKISPRRVTGTCAFHQRKLATAVKRARLMALLPYVDGGLENMKIILKQDVENVGRKGDIVNVAAGFGRNFLLPRKLALEVTPSNVKMIEIERQSLKKKVEKERLSYQDLIQPAQRGHPQLRPEGRREGPHLRLGERRGHQGRAGQAGLRDRQEEDRP